MAGLDFFHRLVVLHNEFATPDGLILHRAFEEGPKGIAAQHPDHNRIVRARKRFRGPFRELREIEELGLFDIEQY